MADQATTISSSSTLEKKRTRNFDRFRERFNLDCFTMSSLKGIPSFQGSLRDISLDPESCPYIHYLSHLSDEYKDKKDYMRSSAVDNFQTNLCDLYGGKHPQIIIGMLHTYLLNQRMNNEESKKSDPKKS